MMDLIELKDIQAARKNLPDVVRYTPIVPLAESASNIGHEKLFLKCENLQVTGSYKARAAFTAINSLSLEDRAKGVVLTSSGNFAQAFAYAGRILNVPIVVVMLESTSTYKVAQTRGHGAEVVFCGNDAMQRQPTVYEVAAERGMTAIDTWEYPPVTAGHGSIGMEVLEQSTDVEQVLVPVSSGGMAAGIVTAIKLQRPDVKVIGVQPEAANAAYVSLQNGVPTEITNWHSIADGLSARRPGGFPFAHLKKYLDEIVLISEKDIALTFRRILSQTNLVGEPAGVVAAAGFLAKQVDTTLKTVAVLSGGNVTMEVIGKMLQISGDAPE